MEENKCEGFFIRFNEGVDKWEAKKDGEVFKQDVSLANLKIWIKKFNKKKFEKFNIFYEKYNGEFVIAIVTSITPDNDVWIKYPDSRGDAEKTKINSHGVEESLFVFSKENEDIITEIKKLVEQMEQIEKDIADKESKLKSFKEAE